MKCNKCYVALLLFGLLSLTACEKDKSDTPDLGSDFDRSALLDNLASLIAQAHAVHHSNLTNLHILIADFTANPGPTTLADCKAALHETMLNWQHVAPFAFGEALNLSFELTHNTYPTDTAQIESNISSGGYDLNTAANIDAIGLQAMDYLLFAEGSTATIAQFIGDSARGEYLRNIVAQLYFKSGLLTASWVAGSSTTNDFIANSGTDVGSSLGVFLNAFNKSFEKTTRSTKLGIPAGALTFSMTPLPEHVESRYASVNSIAYLQESMAALQHIYAGGTGLGLDDYLAAMNAQYNGVPLTQAIDDQFTRIALSLSSLQGPLSALVVNDQQAALAAYSELQELVVLFKVDMMSALGVLITYQDNDGD